MHAWDVRHAKKFSRLTMNMLVIVVLIQCVGILDHSLWTPDEPRVAEIAREMSATGRFLIPHFSQKPFLEQPPLYYAAAALCYQLFSTNMEGVGRFASLFFAFGTLGALFLWMRAHFSERAAALSATILATTVTFFVSSHKMQVDIALCFFVTVALLAFLQGWRNPGGPWFKLFWLALILAFLTKGLIGLAIPLIVVIVFIAWQRDFSKIRHMWILPGIFALTAIVVLWAWALYLEGGRTFLRIFFLNNQLNRYFPVNGYHGGHVRPFFYYLANFWYAAAPWSVFLIPALVFSKKHATGRRFFMIWFFCGLLLLSIAYTKRDIYLLPVYPAMAGLVGLWLDELLERAPTRWEKLFISFMSMLLACAMFMIPAVFFLKLRGTLLLSGFLLSFSLVGAWFLAKRLRLDWAHALVLTCTLCYLIWVPPIFTRMDTDKNYKELFMRIGQFVADKPVIGYRLNETIKAVSPFYGGFYIQNIESRRQFENILRDNKPMYVMVIPKRVDEHLMSLLRSSADLAVPDDFRNPKDIEVWEIAPTLLYPLPEEVTSQLQEDMILPKIDITPP